jgi:hypothetical protein
MNKKRNPSWIYFYISLALLVLAACTVRNPAGDQGSDPIAATIQPKAVSQLTASSTPVPSPTTSNTPSPTPSPTITLTPTPTLDPMDIRAMRMTPYPGSDITIEQELDRGANYRRYYASYLSQGLKIYALLTIPDGEQPATGWPAIVFNHGYIPPAQYRTTERYVAYVDWLARSG